jgi:predicted nuclease with RNAse H fold
VDKYPYQGVGRLKNFKVIGVDLAGVPTRPSGMCLLRGLQASTLLLFSDQEIIGWIQEKAPDLVAVDAPLTLPPGRKSIDERNRQHLRPCDEELRRRRIPFFPITLGPMRKLTERGIHLRNSLEKMKINVLEAYPGGAQDILGFPRVKHDPSGLFQGLKNLGIRRLRETASVHELDAATAAYVGLLFLRGEAEVYGDFSTGAIIMPSPSS